MLSNSQTVEEQYSPMTPEQLHQQSVQDLALATALQESEEVPMEVDDLVKAAQEEADAEYVRKLEEEQEAEDRQQGVKARETAEFERTLVDETEGIT